MRSWVGVLALLSSITVAAQPLTVDQKRRIDLIVTHALRDTAVPSASIAIVSDARLDYAQAYGDQRLDGTPAAVTARYEVGSVSKQFTAASILLLAQDGKLALSDKVAKYLPQLTGAKTVTLAQLLSHTAGYQDFWPQDFIPLPMTLATTPRAIAERWGGIPLDYRPGTKFQYSNTGYTIAGLIVERVAKEPLFSFERRRIFEPLGMDVLDADGPREATDAIGAGRSALGPVRRSPKVPAGWLFAAGNLVMAPSELAKWNIARLDRSVLKPASWRQQETDRTPRESEEKYGLGVDIDTVGNHPRIHHDGGTMGFLTRNRVYPADKAAITVVTSGDFSSASRNIADAIEAVVLEPADDCARVRAVFEALRAGTIDRSQFTENGNSYFTPEVLADHHASLPALGELLAVSRRDKPELRGGFTTEAFILHFVDRKLLLLIDTDSAKGLLEQFLVEQTGS